jgi:hypothetical protein
VQHILAPYQERWLVQLTVELGNTGREPKPKTKRQKREAKVKPSATWAEMTKFSNDFIARRGLGGFVAPPTKIEWLKVVRWLRRIASGKLGRLPVVLAGYIARIEMRPVLAFENHQVRLVPTMFRARPIELAALGAAFLLDEEREWHSRFGRCGGCQKFFLDMREGRGPKRTQWCSPKCEDAAKYLKRKIRDQGVDEVKVQTTITGVSK